MSKNGSRENQNRTRRGSRKQEELNQKTFGRAARREPGSNRTRTRKQPEDSHSVSYYIVFAVPTAPASFHHSSLSGFFPGVIFVLKMDLDFVLSRPARVCPLIFCGLEGVCPLIWFQGPPRGPPKGCPLSVPLNFFCRDLRQNKSGHT